MRLRSHCRCLYRRPARTLWDNDAPNPILRRTYVAGQDRWTSRERSQPAIRRQILGEGWRVI